MVVVTVRGRRPASSCTCNPEPWAHTPGRGRTAPTRTGCRAARSGRRGRVPHTCSAALWSETNTPTHETHQARPAPPPPGSRKGRAGSFCPLWLQLQRRPGPAVGLICWFGSVSEGQSRDGRGGALTSAGVLLARPSVLTGVPVAGSGGAAAPVHPEHPPPPRPGPVPHVAHPDGLPVEGQALQAAEEAGRALWFLRRGTGGKQQSTMGRQHAAGLGQGHRGRALLVQGQSEGAGVDLQQDAVPLAV